MAKVSDTRSRQLAMGRYLMRIGDTARVPDPIDPLLARIVPADDWMPWKDARDRLAAQLYLRLVYSMSVARDPADFPGIVAALNIRAKLVLEDAVERGLLCYCDTRRRHSGRHIPSPLETLRALARGLAGRAHAPQPSLRGLFT